MPDVGGDIVLQAEFRNRAGELSDPDVVNAWIKDPTGDVTPLTFAPTSTVGIWECVFLPTLPGDYWWRVDSVGSGVHSAEEKKFTVEDPNVTH